MKELCLVFELTEILFSSQTKSGFVASTSLVIMRHLQKIILKYVLVRPFNERAKFDHTTSDAFNEPWIHPLNLDFKTYY